MQLKPPEDKKIELTFFFFLAIVLSSGMEFRLFEGASGGGCLGASSTCAVEAIAEIMGGVNGLTCNCSAAS